MVQILALIMVRLCGLEPDGDIKIFTGIYPGDRLFEELHTDMGREEPALDQVLSQAEAASADAADRRV